MGAQCVSRVRQKSTRVDTRPAITPEQRDTPACGHTSRARTRRTRNSNTRASSRERERDSGILPGTIIHLGPFVTRRGPSHRAFSHSPRAPAILVRTFVRPDGGLRAGRDPAPRAPGPFVRCQAAGWGRGAARDDTQRRPPFECENTFLNARTRQITSLLPAQQHIIFIADLSGEHIAPRTHANSLLVASGALSSLLLALFCVGANVNSARTRTQS
jgi:hypothetical protein